MQIILCENKKDWNDFLLVNNGSFLQSFEWAEIQEGTGKKTFFYQVKESDNVLCQVLVLKELLRFGKYFFYIPFGPCFKSGLSEIDKTKALDLVITELKKQARAESAIFLHIEPMCEVAPHTFDRVGSFDFLISQKNIQPKKTIVLDLEKPLNDIFNDFEKDTRYSVRTAQKRGVRIEILNHYCDSFYNLLKQTAQRQGFNLFPEVKYKNFFKVKSGYFKPIMFLAKQKNKVIAVSLLVLFGKRATYLHSASDNDYSRLQAPSLLQWEQIKLAKENNCHVYDFWGYDEKKWPGVSHFKKGFNGKIDTYPERYDLVFNSFYYQLYLWLKKILKKV